MAVTYAEFIIRYPAFAGTDPVEAQSKIDAAVRNLPAATWGALFEDGVYLETARTLALSPTGNSAKLVNKDGSTVYDKDLDRMRADVAGGDRGT